MSDTLESSQKPAHRHRQYLLTGLAMLVVLSGGYIGLHYRAAPNAAAAPVAGPQPTIPVMVATAQRRDVPIYLTGWLITLVWDNQSQRAGEILQEFVAAARKGSQWPITPTPP